MEPRTLRATELRYRTEGDDEVCTNLADVAPGPLLDAAPVREFSWHPHQKNYPGWLWTATTGGHVGYESLLERDRVLLADFDVGVTAIVSQPFWIAGDDDGIRRRHAPDYLLARGGAIVVVDVKPRAMCDEPKVAVVLDWTGQLCAAKGWRYEVFHGEDPIVMNNLRFIAQGRRVAFLDAECIAALSAAGEPGMTLVTAEDLVTGFEPLDVRACSLALLWRQAWVADLTVPLSSTTVITATPKGVPCQAEC